MQAHTHSNTNVPTVDAGPTRHPLHIHSTNEHPRGAIIAIITVGSDSKIAHKSKITTSYCIEHKQNLRIQANGHANIPTVVGPGPAWHRYIHSFIEQILRQSHH